MQQKPTKQSGFAHLGVIIILLLTIAVIGFGGWYVWQNNKGEEQPNSSTSPTHQDKNKQRDDAESSDEKKYLVIDEWNVKIPLADDISGAYYNLRTDELAEYVDLYDSEFDGLKNANGISCGSENKYQFYSITRTKPENVDALRELGAGPEYKRFSFSDEYLFGGLRAHQAPPHCANLNADPYGEFQDDTNIINIANDKEKAFEDAFEALITTTNN